MNAIVAGRPFVRWWWLSGPFRQEDITGQLQWLARNGFGGAELAWLDPTWLDEAIRSAPRPDFLSPEWSALVLFTKQQATALGLGCDFTFGSAWPFGGSWLADEDRLQTFFGHSAQRIGNSWEIQARERIYALNHLSSRSLQQYAAPLAHALSPALQDGTSALFCDSLEIDTDELWFTGLFDQFGQEFGYRLEPFAAQLDDHPDVRYDYRRFRGDVLVREFYAAFTALCHRLHARSRVQCHGAPADLLAAYAAVDQPESEAMLFSPTFSRIAASAAAWTGGSVVSAEAFTCLYGFPDWDDQADELWGLEDSGDIKFVADALFANGVNQLVWHGMPYRSAGGEQRFYASIHLALDSRFAAQVPELNDYFSRVCSILQSTEAWAQVGVYLPTEDGQMRDRIEDDDSPPGANFHWEMRDARFPEALEGHACVWISLDFLQEAHWTGDSYQSRKLRLKALVIDCDWLDVRSLEELSRLSQNGARIIWLKRPKQPGHMKSSDYETTLDRLIAQKAQITDVLPLLVGENIPQFWTRQSDGHLYLFFAHPLASKISYPLPYKFSEQAKPCQKSLQLQWQDRIRPLTLSFASNSPVFLQVDLQGEVEDLLGAK